MLGRPLSLVAALLLLGGAASAQTGSTVNQTGSVVTGHVPVWLSNQVVQDGGAAGGATLLGQGVGEFLQVNPAFPPGTGPDGTHTCLYSGLITQSYSYLCFDANALGGPLIEAGGTGSPALKIKVNGVVYPFPGPGGGTVVGPSASTVSEPAVWANTGGTSIKDGLNVAIVHTGTFSVAGTISIGTLGSQYVFTDHSNIDFYQPNSVGTVKLAAGLNGGFASNTAGSECGDIDFPIYVNGAPSIFAINGCVSGHPALTPSVGDTWNIGGPGQSILNLFVDEILDEGSNVLVGPSNYSGGVPQNFNLMAGRLTGTASNALAVFDAAGHQVLNVNSIGTAVNYPALLARATGTGPSLQALGSDTNINLNLVPKGTGAVHVLDSPFMVDGVATFNNIISATRPIDLFGSSSGFTELSSLNTGSGNFSIAFPAASGTVALVGGVTSSFSAGSTGLTPNTPTIGDIVLGGILAAGSGGTGLNTASATGVAQVNTGTWSISTTLPSGLQIPGLTFTATTGTPPFVVGSTTNVPNLNASSLGGATFANPGIIGGGATSAAFFTTLTATTYMGLPTGSASVFGVFKVDGTTITAPSGVLTVVGGSATTITVGSTTITSGTSNGLLYDAAGTLGNLATANNGVLVTGAGGVPAVSTTLPSGLTASNITLINSALGTPSAIVLTNGTGLPIGGITGLGTGVGSALAVNVGTAGAFVVNGGALGTPSSGTATNLTGLPIAGITGLGTGVATLLAGTSSGSTGIAGTTSPHFVTPVLGAATGTSLNVSGSVTAGSYVGLPVGSSSVFGVVEVDNVTITASGGVISAVGSAATSVTVGTTTVGSGTTQQILFDNAGTLGEITKGASSVLVSNGSSVPSWSTTLPSGLAATNLTLTTPALGTPSAVVLTNGTGLPISTGVAGLGTGVATLLAGTASGTGGPAGTTSPSFTTPALGTATGTSLTITGQFTSTVSTGTAPLVVSSTTVVSNLNAAFLNGATFASPGTIGGTTAAAANFTNVALTGYEQFSGTTLPTQGAGVLGIGGIATVPTVGANGEGDLFLTSTGGLSLIGQGSANDLTLRNSAGTAVAVVTTGSTGLTITAGIFNVEATAPSVPSGQAWVGMVQGSLGAGYCSLEVVTATNTQVIVANVPGTGC